MFACHLLLWFCLAALAWPDGSPAAASSSASETAASAPVVGTLSFVESVPLETDLDLTDVPQAADVWLDMIAAAHDSIGILAFYFSPHPDGSGSLEPLLAALETAARRGVVVRTIADRGFHDTYPETTVRLGQVPGIETRLLDADSLWGGVQHAKGFAVDGEVFYLGSQNWDWRALTHIHELGIQVRHAELTRRFGELFALDWELAADAAADGRPPSPSSPSSPPSPSSLPSPPSPSSPPFVPDWFPLATAGGDTVLAALAASPPQALPAGLPWDEPLLVALLDSARERIRVQLLSYSPADRDGGYYELFDTALRRAAARGVRVEMILSNWAKRRSSLPYIRSLAVLPNVEIRFTNIPPWSGGFIPYARVDHAKYVTVDGDRLWLGTANWARSYFHSSRNISLFLRGDGCCDVPDRFFGRTWTSRYAETVDAGGSYAPPRRN